MTRLRKEIEKTRFLDYVRSCLSGNKMKLLRLFIRIHFLLTMTTESYNFDTSHAVMYEIPLDGERGSYFGMTVAIRPKAASPTDTWSIQIGAPRGNVVGEGVLEPGAVYRCNTYGPCSLFLIDRGLSSTGGVGIYEFKEKKDAAWTGVAMDIKSFGSHEKTVVCGHRWINQNLRNSENIDVTYLMTGVCYLQDLLNETSDTPVTRLLPLISKDKIYTPKPYVADLSTYHWGLGQAGFSVKLLDEPSSLLIGAPGVTHWIGSVIKYENDVDIVVGSFTRTELARKSRYTYLGYSLAFGRFYQDKKLWYATGAPRSSNYHGEVSTFQFKGSSGDVQIETVLSGATFGEYFGSSLTTVDVNSDGYDDLIVGSPLFSSKDPDEGRIYVYLGTGRGYFLVLAQTVNGRVAYGRFGSCVASIQDLDQDGYGDVAVGAPYEDNEKGAVYVYRGFAKGLQEHYSQRIRARDIHLQLRGFGISISPAVDTDGNNYLDIAIGSYLSDNVVLIRSRPVISIHPQIKTENLSLIDRKESHINLTVCSRYDGSHAPEHVVITETVEVDPAYGRGTFSLFKNSFLKKSIHLRRNETICEIHTVLLNMSRKIFSPLHIYVKNEIDSCQNVKGSLLLIKEKKSKKPDGFQKTCPMGNKADTSREIPFAGLCGPDLICRSDLKLTCDVPDFRSGFYTLDSSDVLVLSMKVRNYGEPAYQTKIKIWSNLKLIRNDNEHIVPTSTNTFWLPVEGNLTESHQTHFSFQIDFEALTENQEQTHIYLFAEIFTASLELNTENNNCKFSVKLISDSSLNIYASSSISNIYITKEMRQNHTLSVTHYYEVRKTGKSLVKDVELKIYIPFYLKEKLLSYTTELSESMHIFDRCDDKNVRDRNECQRKKESAFTAATTSRHLDEKMLIKNNLPVNRTLFLNCSKTSEINCNVLKVFFTKNSIPNEFSCYVKIILSINITALDSVKNQKDIVHLSTTGILKVSTFTSKEPEEHEKSTSVSLYSEENEFTVDVRIVALSLMAGGFLLSLIVTGLIKSDFFVRAKKEELKALKNANDFFVYFGTGESASAIRRANASGTR